MLNFEIAKKILITTEDTFTELLSGLVKLGTIKEKKLLLKELSKDFNELYGTYIKSSLEVRDDKNYLSIYPRFKKGVDDLYVETNDIISYEREATSNWVNRKKDELANIDKNYNNYKNITDKGIYSTIENFLSYIQLKQLYEFLSKKENPYIKNCDLTTFLEIFATFSDKTKEDNTIKYQPKIHWVKGHELFEYFFYFLENCNFISIVEDGISAKLINGQFFVNAKDSNNIKPLSHFSKSKSKDKRIKETINYLSKNAVFEHKNFEFKEDFKALGDCIKSFQKK